MFYNAWRPYIMFDKFLVTSYKSRYVRPDQTTLEQSIERTVINEK